MRTDRERADEVRRNIRRAERSHCRRCQALAAAGFAACLAFILGLSCAMPGIVSRAETVYGGFEAAASIFGSSAAMGYVMVGLLSFVLGVCVTALYYRVKALRAHADRTERDHAGDDR